MGLWVCRVCGSSIFPTDPRTYGPTCASHPPRLGTWGQCGYTIGSMSRTDSCIRSFQTHVAGELRALSVAGRLVVAVSGGPDSTAMLHAIWATRLRTHVGMTAAHANHQLRGPESDRDQEFVGELCEQLGVPLVCQQLPVEQKAEQPNEGVEQAARRLRQEFFLNTAGSCGAGFVTTAHTADDQAETILQRIIRGTGIAGLAGIPRCRSLASGVQLIRPMLALRRSEVLRYLSHVGQDFREDSSNRDLNFTRNRLRQELLPYLARHLNPQVTDAVVRLGGLAGQAQAVIDGQIRRLESRAIVELCPERVVLDTSRLRRAGTYLICELLRRIWIEQSWPLKEIGQDHFERIAGLVTGQSAAWDLPGGIRAKRVRDRVVLEGPKTKDRRPKTKD